MGKVRYISDGKIYFVKVTVVLKEGRTLTGIDDTVVADRMRTVTCTCVGQSQKLSDDAKKHMQVSRPAALYKCRRLR